MKEVLTKSFWKDVKKTFEEARDNPPPGDKPEDNASTSPPTETATPPADASEQK